MNELHAKVNHEFTSEIEELIKYLENLLEKVKNLKKNFQDEVSIDGIINVLADEQYNAPKLIDYYQPDLIYSLES